MSRRDGRDYILLIWKDPNSRRNFVVGDLSINGNYEFKYDYEIDEAIEHGFELIIPFDDVNKVYNRDILFPAFSSRLPDKKRRGIDKILNKYGLNEYDEYRLLKRSGAKLPIDNLEFIDPILKNDQEFARDFYIQGVRHYHECEDMNSDINFPFNVGDLVQLEMELENQYDENVIMIKYSQDILGYVPRYYSEVLTRHLKNGATYQCKITDINQNQKCENCIKVELRVSN